MPNLFNSRLQRLEVNVSEFATVRVQSFQNSHSSHQHGAVEFMVSSGAKQIYF